MSTRSRRRKGKIVAPKKDNKVVTNKIVAPMTCDMVRAAKLGLHAKCSCGNHPNGYNPESFSR